MAYQTTPCPCCGYVAASPSPPPSEPPSKKPRFAESMSTLKRQRRGFGLRIPLRRISVQLRHLILRSPFDRSPTGLPYQFIILLGFDFDFRIVILLFLDLLQTDFLDYLIESSDFSNMFSALLEFYYMGHASNSLPGLRYGE
ncbi:hypothetical protein FNV43_RR02410 [Rhamnella rubrinervis]|uniref:Uncharacterized protein n=1 Tax=Rhamnella rubrinervis TaxID=2594499 RepID=A0A8K0HS79_9ROSA|nr:hypothetical protein FNV43_RR02410 [Rhamnella rubrinervis]